MNKTLHRDMHQGIPTITEYNSLLNTDLFRSIENFSNSFINKVGNEISGYNNKWVFDPLHQWSRQWEYAYIINSAIGLSKNAKAIDLGAGLTFLPYYLQSELGLQDVLAIDYDPMLNDLYTSVNASFKNPVKFESQDMRSMSNIPTNSFDFAYSVSVLEHTNSYEEIFGEIYRILRPGGKLSFSFDISINGLDDIPVGRASEFVESLYRTFKAAPNITLADELKRESIVISSDIINANKSLSPWKYPILNIIKPMINKGVMGSKYKKLTCCCLTVQK